VVGQAPPLEYFMPTPYFSLARFGKWDALLKEPAPSAQLKYTTGMWRYTRGLAFAAKGQPDQAQAERDSVAALAAAIPAEQPAGINSAKKLLTLAERHLTGEIAAAKGDTAYAIAALEEAIKIEDELTYDEPPPWYHPMRQELGRLLLAAGQPARAERMFREDLEYWPNNGWSLSGLAKSLRAQKKDAEALKAEQQFRKVWTGADVEIAAMAH
jgi:tetratricopeptide (TPR) repeat protein